MDSHFSRDSVEASKVAINLAINRGCQIFDKKFKRVLEQASKQSILTIESLANNACPRIDYETVQIIEDVDAKKIRENMLSGMVRMDNRGRYPVSRVPVKTRENRRYEPIAKTEVSDKTRSQTRTESRGCIMLDLGVKDSEADKQRDKLEEEHRRKRAMQIKTKKQHRLLDEERKQRDVERLKSLLKERATLLGKKHPYTFDYEGKVMNCSLNQRENPQQKIKIGVKLSEQQIKPQHNSSYAQTGRLSNKQNLQSRNSKKNQALIQRDEEFTNNYCRQVTSIPIIQLSGGTKIEELNTSVHIQQPKPFRIFKNEYLETIKRKRFKSYVKTEGAFLDESMSEDKYGNTAGFTKKTLETSSTSQGFTTGNLGVSRKKKPRGNASYKRVPFYLFTTSQKFFDQKKNTLLPKFENKITIQKDMSSILLD